METEKNFTHTENDKEYVLQLGEKKCPCWMFLIPLFMSLIFTIIILVIYLK